MQEFMAEFRPQGYGKMQIQDMSTGEIVMDSQIEEVICDTCNNLIGKDEHVNMFFKDSYAVCDKCSESLKKEGGN
jgi:hypothetical protein